MLDSSYMSNSEELFRKENTEDITEWLDLCKNATTNKQAGEKFRNILQKNLTEVI